MLDLLLPIVYVLSIISSEKMAFLKNSLWDFPKKTTFVDKIGFVSSFLNAVKTQLKICIPVTHGNLGGGGIDLQREFKSLCFQKITHVWLDYKYQSYMRCK